MKEHMEQPTCTSSTELHCHIKLQSSRQQLTKRKKNLIMVGYFLPLLQVAL